MDVYWCMMAMLLVGDVMEGQIQWLKSFFDVHCSSLCFTDPLPSHLRSDDTVRIDPEVLFEGEDDISQLFVQICMYRI